ncbi:MAG TPA: S8 family serine peptidase [Mycobacteriales bacterium]|nr:S8 family serine peptidase [Mycobacteriales bacterium]
MSRPAALRRSSVSAALAALAVAGVPLVADQPELQAVVSFQGRPVSAPGVQVVSELPGLGMQVVRGDALSLLRLAQTQGVRGLSPDVAVQVTSDEEDGADSGVVSASAALGGTAGTPGAGSGTRVAVIDTGVSDTPALNRASGRLVDAVDTSTGTVRTGGRYDDGYGHGTFMANLVAGGVAPGTDGASLGVAPGATVLVVRVAGADGSTSLTRVLAALDWVRGHASGVDVVNLSLSAKRPFRQYGADPLTDAVENVRDAGVSVVVSAGNKRSELGDPGFDPRVITVGAADLAGDRRRVATFSGSDVVAGVVKPDVVASGVHVLGVLPAGSTLAADPSTVHLGDGLFRGTGTSQSTAITSGLAAILLAAHPHATPAQVKASLRCAATDLPGRRDGAGLVGTTTTLCAGTDGQALDGSGDLTGEASFDASSWAASSWAGPEWVASSWAASSWAASSWAASSWAASSWAASSWAASSWAASSWAASSWAASSWAASSWAASSWAASSWGPADVGVVP